MLSKLALLLLFGVLMLTGIALWIAQSTKLPENYLAQAASTCGGNCPSGSCRDCYCGNTISPLTADQISAECSKVFTSDFDMKCCIHVAT